MYTYICMIDDNIYEITIHNGAIHMCILCIFYKIDLIQIPVVEKTLSEMNVKVKYDKF